MKPSVPIITIDRLSYWIDQRQILGDVSLTIEAGDCWLLFGPNGAGKTTLLNIISGFIREFSGNITILTRPFASIKRRELARSVAYLPQINEFTLPLRVRDLLLAGRYPYTSFLREYNRDDWQRIEEISEQFKLTDYWERDINSLSGGERKKVLLASILVQDVSLILLDEPFTFLDPESIQEFKRIIGYLKQSGKTLVIVSHQLEELFDLVDHMAALKNGKMSYSGAAVFNQELFRDVLNVNYSIARIAGSRKLFKHE